MRLKDQNLRVSDFCILGLAATNNDPSFVVYTDSKGVEFPRLEDFDELPGGQKHQHPLVTMISNMDVII